MAYKNWTEEEESHLRELVATGKYSYRQIGALMNRSLASITCHARQYLDINNNVYESRKYHHDVNFFKTPNLINCYIAGFLAADGCVRQSKKGYWTLRLELSVLDVDHLNWIKNTIGHDGPITHYTKKENSMVTKKSPMVFFSISVSEDYVKDLAAFGIVPRKSHRLTPPSFTDFSLKFAYLLGLLDGDGCIHLSNTNNLSVGMASSSRVAVEWYKTLVEGMKLPLIRNKTPNILRPRDNNVLLLTYMGARAVCLVQLGKLFATKHSLPILDRKWKRLHIDLYIKEFYSQFPSFKFDPHETLARLEQSHLFL